MKKSDVGRYNADQRHVRNIVSLGDHLRTDQYVVVSFAKILQDGFVVAFAGNRVAIEPRDARFRQLAMQLLFHFFRA